METPTPKYVQDMQKEVDENPMARQLIEQDEDGQMTWQDAKDQASNLDQMYYGQYTDNAQE